MKKTIQKIKLLLIKDAPINYDVINTIAKGIVANDRTILVEHGRHLTFRVNWAQHILNEIKRSEKKMVWRMATILKTPIAPGLLKEEQFKFQRKTQALIKWHNIPKNLVVNLDQTHLSYITVGNSTLEFESATSVPVKGKGKGKQITRNFSYCCWPLFTDAVKYVGKTISCHSQNMFHWDLKSPNQIIIGAMKSCLFNMSIRSYFFMWKKLKKN